MSKMENIINERYGRPNIEHLGLSGLAGPLVTLVSRISTLPCAEPTPNINGLGEGGWKNMIVDIASGETTHERTLRHMPGKIYNMREMKHSPDKLTYAHIPQHYYSTVQGQG